MRTLSSFIALAVMLSFAGTCFAAGKLPYDKSGGKNVIQNLVGLSPDPAVSNCTTATKTKGTIVTINNNAGYIGLKWWAVGATGTAIMVKRTLNANDYHTAFMPESGGTMLFNGSITSTAFNLYSTNSPVATTVCVELQ